jgi:hypothetical protein
MSTASVARDRGQRLDLRLEAAHGQRGDSLRAMVRLQRAAVARFGFDEQLRHELPARFERVRLLGRNDGSRIGLPLPAG